MAEGESKVLCPTCRAVVTVDPGWRLVRCPRCGAMITRMSVDSSFD